MRGISSPVGIFAAVAKNGTIVWATLTLTFVAGAASQLMITRSDESDGVHVDELDGDRPTRRPVRWPFTPVSWR